MTAIITGKHKKYIVRLEGVPGYQGNGEIRYLSDSILFYRGENPESEPEAKRWSFASNPEEQTFEHVLGPDYRGYGYGFQGPFYWMVSVEERATVFLTIDEAKERVRKEWKEAQKNFPTLPDIEIINERTWKCDNITVYFEAK